ncbi:hypothetical protein [Pseudoalteromonas sp. B160]|uniref:hypothetical protein n=1 Tax=Pseudoalteromonas sp. B160 TaxID=630414 RepID=UPI00301E60BB
MNKMTRLLPLTICALAVINAQASDEKELEEITVFAVKPDGLKISSDKLLSLPGTGNDPLKGLEALLRGCTCNSRHRRPGCAACNTW